ncbi:hypothetical protein K435DRAFT_960130 [Dendrothele bispora CBS 962.96]|uniref:ABC-2 type transporter domain-containing protein n=1 Tax=Dendrothele bispora (strain CBS 962.96) TaxID=1314807 RepID=A0A4S8MUW6_DENBC|nr:hypothetical protein K435DRAFT_960130 [Dendrothele bispora CBS 962.96]
MQMAARARIVSWDKRFPFDRRCSLTPTPLSLSSSTRGLDSSTALEYVLALRTATDVVRMTTIVCVIYEGKCAYFGPTSEAHQYFIDMGYNRQTTPNFLVAVTNRNGPIPRSLASSPASSPSSQPPAPKIATEYADYFNQSRYAPLNRRDINQYNDEMAGNQKAKDAYQRSARGEHVPMSRKKSAYIVSLGLQVREFSLLLTLRVLADGCVINVDGSYMFQVMIAGAIYLKSSKLTVAYFSRGGILYFALLFSALTTMAEISSLFSQRPILLRRMQRVLYHPIINQGGSFLVDLPIFVLYD